MEEVGQQLSILHDSVEDAVQGGALRFENCPEKDASN